MVTPEIGTDFTLVFIIAIIVFICFETYMIISDMPNGELSSFILLNVINILASLIVGATLALLWVNISQHFASYLYFLLIVLGIILIKIVLWYIYKWVNKV